MSEIDIVAEMRGSLIAMSHTTDITRDKINRWADHMERLQAREAAANELIDDLYQELDDPEMSFTPTSYTGKLIRRAKKHLQQRRQQMSKQTFNGVEYDIKPHANLSGANLTGAKLPDGTKNADQLTKFTNNKGDK